MDFRVKQNWVQLLLLALPGPVPMGKLFSSLRLICKLS